MSMMSDEDLARLAPAESSLFASPIPVQSVSSDEFMPAPQTERQREFEARVKAIGSELSEHQGMSRRAFFKTSAGMAAAFVAMNETFGPLYMVSRAEAATPEMANARAAALKGQFIMDMHTHFLRDDTRLGKSLGPAALVSRMLRRRWPRPQRRRGRLPWPPTSGYPRHGTLQRRTPNACDRRTP
jgi:hypothetical protein